MDRLLRAASLLGFPAFRALDRPVLLPLSLTVSVTYSCSSRCKTCDIWRKRADDLRLEEYERIFRSLGRSIAWVTLSGGDQFLRVDLPDIVGLVRELLRPSVINIPMNGILTHRIEELLPKIAQRSRGSSLVLNFSVDEIGSRHDDLRGYQGSYERVQAAIRLAKRLQQSYPHISVGIHTVVSRNNVERLGDIFDEVSGLAPDAFLSEIAEERVELGTMGKEIAPDPDSYARAIGALKSRMRRAGEPGRLGRLVQALRYEYYDLVQRILRERRQVIPCYAGWASAQIAPDGDVWGCCVRAEVMGNLRQVGYDFRRVWSSHEARLFRASVRANQCACPLANAAYVNMLFSPSSLARVVFSYLGTHA
jgi:MoaA/NifB/PqqE/SkfB family radical SAM enzyme